MNTLKRRQLSSLLSKIVDGRAEDTHLETLDRLMSGDEGARAYYLHHLALHTDLERHGGLIEAQAKPLKQINPPRRFAFVTAAACILLAAIAAFFHSSGKTTVTLLSSTVRSYQTKISAPTILAVIGNVDQPEWSLEDTPPKQGTLVGQGMIHLTSGRIRLDFNSGENITIEGPSTFELIDTKRLRLDEGRLVAVAPERKNGFTIMMPGGAAVTLGTELAVTVTQTGQSHIRVIKGMVMTSSTNEQGNTSWQQLLEEGDEYTLTKSTPPQQQSFTGQIPIRLESEPPALRLNENYAAAVLSSKPLAYWRFNLPPDARTIQSEVGNPLILLGGNATINRSGALSVNPSGPAYAISSEAFPRLNSSDGCSIELWAISNSVEWQSLAGLMLEGPRPKHLLPFHARHNPHLLLLERAGVEGSKQHHIHPNFAVRSVYYSPLAYVGGVNAYSNADYLIHAWHHFVVVKEAGHLKIYVDGLLSGSTPSSSEVDPYDYKLLLGRLHTLENRNDARPWSGAIDEVALYNYALDAGKIKAHHDASKK